MDTIYEKVLTVDKLKGRRDCEIRYVYTMGRWTEIINEAKLRNIELTNISRQRFKSDMKAGDIKW